MDTTGITLAILSALFMGTIGVFSRITGLPAETITFFRLLLGAGFLAIFLLATRQAGVLRHWPTWPVIVNGALLAGFIIFYVQAMNLTSMANAIMLVYLAPVAASIFAHFFMGERLNFAGWILIGLAMLGFAAMMEFRLDFADGSNHAAGLGLAALAICPQLRETLRIPADHSIGYALLFGKPDVQYYRPVKRGPATVNILE